MKILIKDVFENYFCKSPEVGLTKIKSDAYVFNCYNQEHAKLILQKTKDFISNENLELEFIDTNEIDLRV